MFFSQFKPEFCFASQLIINNINKLTLNESQSILNELIIIASNHDIIIV